MLFLLACHADIADFYFAFLSASILHSYSFLNLRHLRNLRDKTL